MRFFAGITVMFCVLLAGMPLASAQTDGLAYKEDTTFTVREDSVEVVTEAVMTNTTAERRRGNTVYYSYFDSFIVVVPKDAEDVQISTRGRSLRNNASELDEIFELRTAQLPTQLRSGQTRSFTVRYTLPRGEIRGDDLFFSNPAFHAFAMWSFSDPGTGSLTLRVPEEAELNDFGDRLRRVGVDEGYVEWEPLTFDTPEEVFIFVTATLDDGLVAETFDVANQSIELRAWPGDTEWSNFAKETITDGLPTLEALIGLPVPDQSTLEITESVTPYFYGYAGWYNTADTSIEVGNELDTSVMIHELSHAWFNDGLFAERWMSEGLAEEFTWQAHNELGWDAPRLPSKPLLGSRYASPLVEWGRTLNASSDDAELREIELYGYETSWYVVNQIADTIGLDGMQNVLAAADSDTIAYVGHDPEEITIKLDDWRRVLDLASENATAEGELHLDELFSTYVVREGQVADIEVRRIARDDYAEFVGSDLNWRVPDELREAMNSCKFASADAIMNNGQEVQDRYADVFEAASEADLELSDAAREFYERDIPDFPGALQVLDGQEAAIVKVDAVRATVDRTLSTEERWGIGELTRDVFAAHAVAAFAADDPNEIAVAQAGVDDLLARSAVAGAARILWAKIGAGASVAIVLLLIVMIVRRRRAKRGTQVVQSEGEAPHQVDVDSVEQEAAFAS